MDKNLEQVTLGVDDEEMGDFLDYDGKGRTSP